MGLALIGRSREALAALGSLVADPTKVGSDGQHRLTARGALRAALDDLPGARRDLEAFVGATRGEVAPQRLVAMGVLAEVDFRLGDWDASVTLAEHAISLAEDSEQLWVLGFLHTVAMQVYGGRGAWNRAEQHLDDARRIAGVLGDPATFAVCENAGVLLASYRSEPGEVVERAQLLVLLDDGPTVEPGWLTWPAPYVSALIQLGRLDEAHSAILTFEGTARERGSRSRLAALARLRGELATARRDHPVAREAFEEALRLGDGVADALEQASRARVVRPLPAAPRRTPRRPGTAPGLPRALRLHGSDAVRRALRRGAGRRRADPRALRAFADGGADPAGADRGPARVPGSDQQRDGTPAGAERQDRRLPPHERLHQAGRALARPAGGQDVPGLTVHEAG